MSTKTQSIFVIFLLVRLSNQETCHFQNTQGSIDLTPLNSLKAYQTLIPPPSQNTKTTAYSTFYFHPCTDLTNIPGVEAPNDCTGDGGYSLCKVDYNPSATSLWSYKRQGTSTQGKFVESGGALVIAYGDGAESVINLVCISNLTAVDTSSFVYMNGGLFFYTPFACLRAPSHESTHSVGSVLLLILGIFLLVYFVGGFFFKYCAYGARGVEAFPHHEFWTSLPGLVRDGVRFIANGCRSVNTQDVYDQI